MKFDELKIQIKSLGVEELRKEQDDYLEAVVLNIKVKELDDVLRSALGKPIWPSWKGLSAKVRDAIKDYGGVLRGQTLYYYNNTDNAVVFAMLWPWQDGQNTTVKIVHHPPQITRFRLTGEKK